MSTKKNIQMNLKESLKDFEEKKKNIEAIIKTIDRDEEVLDYLVGINNFRNKNIVDLGWGACIPSAGIAHLSPYIISVDISKPNLKDIGDEVLKHYNAFTHRICADFNNLPFRDSTVDIVLGGGYLHHASDINGLLREIRRVLKNNGLFISVHESIKTITWKSKSHTSEIDYIL